jgi:signal transduction histidine kinase/CheY-like chemotaxis protein
MMPSNQGASQELGALDERIALLSVLQELTVAVLDLFRPSRRIDEFVEKVAARLGCSVALCVEVRRGGLVLCGSAGLAARSRELPLPAVPGARIEEVRFPYPELGRLDLGRWILPTQAADSPALHPSWLVLYFERQPRHALQYRGMAQRLAAHLGAALAHRAMYERVLDSERDLQDINDDLERRVRVRTHELASANEELRKRERSLRVLSACNSSVVRSECEAALLRDACRILVEVGGHRTACVALARTDDRGTLALAAHAGHEGECPPGMEANGGACAGPVATAARTGAPSVAPCLPTSAVREPWHAEALRHGYAAIAAVPLVAEGATLGVLAVYSAEADGFDADEMRLLAGVAADVAFGVAALRGRERQAHLTAQLVQADRLVAIGTLAAAVGHEINNPLSYVQSGLDFVVDELCTVRGGADPSLAEVRSVLDDMRSGIQRIRSVARDLRTFARSDQDSRRPLQLREVLDSSIDMARNEIRHRATLVKEYGVVPCVEANESRLGQVFLNLLINAAHSIPEGAAGQNEIRVATRTDGAGSAVVEITDTGCGISPRDLDRIFEPFFTTKPAGIGTGLGLSICRNVVTALGGTICAQSDVGKGSTFRLVLPPARVSPPPPDAPPSPRPADIARRRILVVDDEPLVGTAIRRSLAVQHDVTVLTSAREAHELIARGERFDAIVCDLMMPEMTGMEFHDGLAAAAPDQAARIVFMTGGAFTANAREFLARVRNPRLEKPFEPAELCGIVRTVAA